MINKFSSISVTTRLGSTPQISVDHYTVIDGYHDRRFIAENDETGLVCSFDSSLIDKQTAEIDLSLSVENKYSISHYSYTTGDIDLAIESAKRVIAAYIYREAYRVGSQILMDYALAIRGRGVMCVKISESAYIGKTSIFDSQARLEALKQLKRGVWYAVDEEFLFDNKYNLIVSNTYIDDQLICAIENDPREKSIFKKWGGVKPSNNWPGALINFVSGDVGSEWIDGKSCFSIPPRHRLQKRFDHFWFTNGNKTDFKFLVYENDLYSVGGRQYSKITDRKMLEKYGVAKYAMQWLIDTFDIKDL